MFTNVKVFQTGLMSIEDWVKFGDEINDILMDKDTDVYYMPNEIKDFSDLDKFFFAEGNGALKGEKIAIERGIW